MKDTLCWKCSKAINGCPWSKNFRPVPKWKATPTKVKGSLGYDSYIVHECPLFEPDDYIGFQVTTKKLAEICGISKRTIFRKKESWIKQRLEIAGYRLEIIEVNEKKSYHLLKIKNNGVV